MKKKTVLKYLFATMIVLFTLAGALVGSMAWFVTIVSINDANIKGSSAGAYFAYGNGKSLTYTEGDVNRPFGITLPRHFYNLAWLQYMGEFKDDQYYFELANDIDMTGYVLPPIGTTKYPFVSYFNGNGHVISGLTVSSDKDELFSSARHPDVTSVNYTDPEIIGLFGVVGNLDDGSGAYSYEGSYSSSINQITDLGVSGITVKSSTSKVLAGMVAGYVDAEVKNVAVNDSKIDITQENTACVKSSWTNNVSDFGSIGYATKNYKKNIKKVEHDIYDVNIENVIPSFNASDSGDDQGFGGSINMKTIYNRIASLRRTKATSVAGYNSTNPARANWRINRTYYDNAETNTTNVNTLESNNNAYTRYNGYNETGHQYIGSYNVYARSENQGYYGDGDTDYGDQQFLYLCGGHYENRSYYSYYRHNGRYITDGTNYLTFDGSSLGNTTSASAATLWEFTAYSGSVYYITTQYNNTTYYLYYNSGSLGIIAGTGENRRWLVDDSGTYRDIKYNGNTNYHLTYSGGWTLLNTSGSLYYIIYDASGHYFKAPTNRNILSGNASEAAHWSYNSSNKTFALSSNSSYVISYSDGGWFGTTYYVQAYSSYDNAYAFSGTPSTTHNAVVSGTFSYTTSSWGRSTTYYIYYSGSNDNYPWGRTTTSTSLNVKCIDPSVFTPSLSKTTNESSPKVGPDSHQTSEDITNGTNNSHMYYTAEDTTYFPLNVNEDLKNYTSTASTVNSEISSGHFDPKTSNTGYIISGSNIPSSASSFARTYSDIRISRYAVSEVGSSFKPGDGSIAADSLNSKLLDSDVYTIDVNKARKTMNQVNYNASDSWYTRYKESKDALLKNSLASSSDNGKTYTKNKYVYGLHFMDSVISKNSIVNASKVSVLGHQCDNYQFPVDCIDFNLKQKGIVNFFAGAYFTDNNSFFSLHHILRNTDAVQKVDNGEPVEDEYTSYNTISDIKEIEEIYVHGDDVGMVNTKYSVIYKYKNKTGNEMYSKPYRISGSKKYVMNPTSSADSSTLYEYDTMGEDDFNNYVSTYHYYLKFKTSQIGKDTTNITQNNYIYYFEFPMNDGEYCLGSVDGGTGAYLLYLDIGANAAKTERTMFYEHFKEINKLFYYPIGVAIIDTSVVSTNRLAGKNVDELDTSNFVIYAGSKGSIDISRDDNDVTLDRSVGFTKSAKPTLVGDNMWDSERHEYMIHDPGDNNLSDEISPITTISESTRLTLFDYSVISTELIKTSFTDTVVYVSASGMNVNGVHYYINDGNVREATYYDLETGTVSVSGLYYDDNGTITSAAGMNTKGVHYYSDLAGENEKTIADLPNDTIEVSGFSLRVNEQIYECKGDNVNGVHYYSEAACTTEVELKNLPDGTIADTSKYYIGNGSGGYVASSGASVNGTDYYLDNDGLQKVRLYDLPNGTVNVDDYFTKVSTGRTVVQYYEDGTSTDILSQIKVYDHTNNGAKFQDSDLMDSSVISTVKTSINNTLLISFEYTLSDGATAVINYVIEYDENGELSPARYYLFGGYTVEINYNDDELIITVIEWDGDTTIIIKDLTTGGSETVDGSGTIEIELPLPTPTPTPTA